MKDIIIVLINIIADLAGFGCIICGVLAIIEAHQTRNERIEAFAKNCFIIGFGILIICILIFK